MSVRKRRVNIQHKATRVLISEVLPYELPATFSNAGFYDFAKRVNLTVDGEYVQMMPPRKSGVDQKIAEAYLKILFGKDVIIQTDVDPNGRSRFRVKRKNITASIPLGYKIRQRSNEFRRLSIPHPVAQLIMSEFYDKYKSAILYYTNRSSFSLRHPARITRYTMFRDSIFDYKRANAASDVEVSSEESARLRSFFVYSRFNNVYKFYDSTEFSSAEKQYGFLVHVDVAKCFDSIYTHSLPWALYGKEVVKTDIHGHNATFGGHFDSVMQKLNDNETHGIVTGPEFSRIFAELILQQIDVKTETDLRKGDLVNGRDYTIFRYVDDYFIFMKNKFQRDAIVQCLEDNMAPYRLHLNLRKEKHYTTPFISDISMAKSALRVALKRSILAPESVEGSEGVLAEFRSSSKSLIRLYKTELSRPDIEPYDLANFALSEVERLLEKRLSELDVDTLAYLDVGPPEEHKKRDAHRRELRRALLSCLEFSFYVYSSASLASPAIKVVRIAALVRKFVGQAALPTILCDEIDGMIHRESLMQLDKAAFSQNGLIESLYFLGLLGELPDHFALSAPELMRIMGLTTSDGGTVGVPDSFTVLAACELLRYVADNLRYDAIKESLKEWILVAARNFSDGRARCAEEPMLVLNVLSCPYVEDDFKAKILRIYNVDDTAAITALSSSKFKWFTEWHSIDLHDELLRKRVQEVY